MSRRRTRPAFTALELIVVAAIVAMLAALVLPRIGTAGGVYAADAAARRVAADLHFARQHARLTSAAQSVEFDVDTSSYTMSGLPSPDRSTTAYTVNLSRAPYDALLTAVDFGGKPTLTFSAFGLPDAGGSVSVRAGRADRAVNVNDATGEATTP
jgi:prepilin-type N-terminal cleavage/methylation domain-containing protein